MDPIKDLLESMDAYITAKVNEIIAHEESKEHRRRITHSAKANLELSLRYAIAKRSSSTQITAIRIEKDPDEEES
jgi:hypothetical protein